METTREEANQDCNTYHQTGRTYRKSDRSHTKEETKEEGEGR